MPMETDDEKEKRIAAQAQAALFLAFREEFKELIRVLHRDGTDKNNQETSTLRQWVIDEFKRAQERFDSHTKSWEAVALTSVRIARRAIQIVRKHCADAEIEKHEAKLKRGAQLMDDNRTRETMHEDATRSERSVDKMRGLVRRAGWLAVGVILTIVGAVIMERISPPKRSEVVMSDSAIKLVVREIVKQATKELRSAPPPAASN